MASQKEEKKKRVLIFTEDFHDEKELWFPYYRLREAGIRGIIVGSGSSDNYTSKHGMPVKVDASIDDVDVDKYDGLIIPGGYAPDKMRRYPKMVDAVRRIYDAGKPVGAICHAGWMLSSAGIIKGKKMTSFFSIKDDMVAAGADWVDEKVVVDENLITSRNPDDLPAFMREFISAMGSRTY